MNKNKLEAMMKLNGDTGTSLAEYLDIARGTFSCKINETNGYEFNKREITAIKQKYNLSAEQLEDIFFS